MGEAAPVIWASEHILLWQKRGNHPKNAAYCSVLDETHQWWPHIPSQHLDVHLACLTLLTSTWIAPPAALRSVLKITKGLNQPQKQQERQIGTAHGSSMQWRALPWWQYLHKGMVNGKRHPHPLMPALTQRNKGTTHIKHKTYSL